MFRKTLETTIDIAAPESVVWAILGDFPRFPEWSRFIVGIDGSTNVGSRLSVRLNDGVGKPMSFSPKLLAMTHNEELRWRGTVGARFIFSGEHYFKLMPLPGGRTRVSHGEIFSGLLVPLLWRTLDTRTRTAFGRFNEALKTRVES